MEYIAHNSTKENPDGHDLVKHLRCVAEKASGFFDCHRQPYLFQAAALAGTYHDAGKYQAPVQNHIRFQTTESIDHATLGAQLIHTKCIKTSPLLISALLGHHGGMPDYTPGSGERVCAEARLQKEQDKTAAKAFSDAMQTDSIPILNNFPAMSTLETAPMDLYLAGRMLHSALVDADYLDTEQYFDPDQHVLRGKRPHLNELVPLYDAHITKLREERQEKVAPIRASIQNQCLRAAERPQGIYSLTVPTGGGKTLASMGFGLYHARTHKNIKRILYAIPFTSITEQNAKVFRDIFGEEAVLEQHSAVKPPESGTKTDRASENWDAHIIVTTNVQLFESIFSNKPSQSRKLHNLQDSIIILDEMQALADGVLVPCLAALDALVRNYGVTVVICTATQPRYDNVWPAHPIVNEIIDDPADLFKKMRRTFTKNLGPLDDSDLLEKLRQHRQALCIVNTRDMARDIARALGNEQNGVYHLSTMMCVEHRMKKLDEIRAILSNKDQELPCIVISTSLIEAGVDVDFPVVYREAAGLDSIAQAAGRCNRGGNRPLSPVYVFTSIGKRQPPEPKRLAAITLTEVAPSYPDDMLCQEALSRYFTLRFGAGADLDSKDVYVRIRQYGKNARFPYESIARDFSLIQNSGSTVYIPYQFEARELIDQLRQFGPSTGLMRRLQRFSVNIYPNQQRELVTEGRVVTIHGVSVLDVGEQELLNVYTEPYGLMVSAPAQALFT